jgi:soluble lytic murein transglycosylase-like protein
MNPLISIRFHAAPLLVAVALAWATLAPQRVAGQEAPEPFAALHQRLDSAADRLLSNAGEAIRIEDAPAGQPKAADATRAEVEQFAQEHWNGRLEDLRRALERVQGLRPTLEAGLREEGIPTGLVAVVLVESAGHTTALSPEGARGLWQFMPATARRYGLKVASGTDDRLDVERSSRAAARHLHDLHEQFGSWPLALAAYNAGADTVQKAIRRAGTTDFATLSARRLLPVETRAYVPAVLAAAPLFGGSGLQATGPHPGRGERVVYAELTGK